MFRQTAFALGLGLVATAAVAQQAEAPAQAPGGMDAESTYEAARNQLGILKFCEAEGHSGNEAVVAQEKMVSMLPSGDESKGQAAEQKGASGTVSIAGTEIGLAEAAEREGISVKEQCAQIEAAVNDVAKQLPAG
ncbi:pore-forming ESAT-6 family protein [Paracoccus sp. Z330]|uniref:Pore-forming ESAT-6 family protein n=1 Tax=Paracoccus onchidii TaxID=3017813 RepID=A0ABT4ZFB2_9RHOB|nr:pore-forming ESAT-6 family protein [Paracoccus onchidii]MDB6177782.1 pore-forming ESAT-6 family protein [Paracoccus onchidii]